jgi:hypothetical protein
LLPRDIHSDIDDRDALVSCVLLVFFPVAFSAFHVDSQLRREGNVGGTGGLYSTRFTDSVLADATPETAESNLRNPVHPLVRMPFVHSEPPLS